MSDSKKLPTFRNDLRLFHGPNDHDGSPTYTLYDPVASEYFKISWAQYKMIQLFRVGMTAEELKKIIEFRTPLQVTIQDVYGFFAYAQSEGLLDIPKTTEELIIEAKQQESSLVVNFLTQYLFFKIPLFNPDTFLDNTYPSVKAFFTKKAMIIYAILIAIGALIIINQFESFLHTFTHFFNMQGIVAYTVAILITKIFHELAHAYCAKKYGLKVPTMGVAFLVLLPVLYTDVTHAWRLSSRKKRLYITAAGIITELTIAGIASILWAFSPEGTWKSIFFILASINWINTLAINLNPALRFDGYYLLSDLLGVDNLQNRAFNLTRRELYRVILDLELRDPEPFIEKTLRYGLIIYSIYTWIYRIFLYTAIALFVYFKFTKVLGVFLFGVEILLFFIWPIIYEVKIFLRVKHLMKPNMRAKITLTAILLFTCWLILPLPHSESFPAITVAVDGQPIFTHSTGVIETLNIKQGAIVKKGEQLVVIRSLDLEHQRNIKIQEQKIADKELAIYEKSDRYQDFIVEKQKEVDRLNAEIRSLERLIEYNTIIASNDGIVNKWDELLKLGQYVPKDQQLGELVPKDRIEVISFVPEEDIHIFNIGDTATFVPSNRSGEYTASVIRISPVRAKDLLHPQLSSVYQGDLPATVSVQGNHEIVESYYPVYLILEGDDPLRFGQTGKIRVKGPWRSKLYLFIQYLASLFWQEASV
ncbi:MAG: HlyD family efflux transporter periplasmic adaptor subunit [Chlamydiota bacterium]